MNILILAYACEPNSGSEYGVGWNVPTIFAKNFPKIIYMYLQEA